VLVMNVAIFGEYTVLYARRWQHSILELCGSILIVLEASFAGNIMYLLHVHVSPH
jgi:hypothetical protein